MVHLEQLVHDNRHFLQQAADLIEQISDELYANNDSRYFMSGVGKHIRHILGFYEQFLAGWPEKIDYDARQRSPRLEDERTVAQNHINAVIDQLSQLLDTVDSPSLAVQVKNDDTDTAEDVFSHSTVARELQFLKSHTVHHFAMVAMILKVQGFDPPPEFGVAPSTLVYLKQQAAK